MAKLEFFFDYVSSYSYLADHRLRALDLGEIHYRPMFLGGVMQATGNKPPATVPAKGAYLMRDLKRWAGHYDVPFRMNSVFPQNTIKVLRLALVAQARGSFPDLHPRLFSAMYAEDLDLTQDDVLAGLLESAGLDAADYLSAITDPAVKAQLKENTEEAVERGAFGAPTFFVGEEMFFGNDRFDFITEALQRAS